MVYVFLFLGWQQVGYGSDSFLVPHWIFFDIEVTVSSVHGNAM